MVEETKAAAQRDKNDHHRNFTLKNAMIASHDRSLRSQRLPCGHQVVALFMPQSGARHPSSSIHPPAARALQQLRESCGSCKLGAPTKEEVKKVKNCILGEKAKGLGAGHTCAASDQAIIKNAISASFSVSQATGGRLAAEKPFLFRKKAVAGPCVVCRASLRVHLSPQLHLRAIKVFHALYNSYTVAAQWGIYSQGLLYKF